MVNVAIFMIQAIVYLLCWLFQKDLILLHYLQYFYFPLDIHELPTHWYSILTFQFFHHPTSPGHIFMNMLTLYFIAPMFIIYFGEKKMLPVYLSGGIFGALLSLFFYSVFPAFSQIAPSSVLFGASAGIMAILFAATIQNPKHEVFLFGIFRLQILYLSLFVLFIDIASISGDNHGGHIAHIGGAFFGFVFSKCWQQHVNIVKPWEVLFDWLVTTYYKFFKRRNMRVVYNKYQTTETSSNTSEDNYTTQEKIDQILDKISRSGYESLSREEKEILKNFSN